MRLTCRRLEGEVELFVRCFLYEGTKQLEFIGCRSKATGTGLAEEKTGQGEEPSTPEKRVYTPVGGCLGLASMGLTK